MAVPSLTTFGAVFNRTFRSVFSGSDDQPTLSNMTKGIGTLLSHFDPGAVATASLNIATNPSDTNTVTIGGDVYEFCTAAGATANDTNIGVVIGANAAASRDNLIAAINGSVSAATGLTNASGGPAEANGTEDFYADEIGTEVRIRSADGVGGTIECRYDTTEVAQTLTDAADIWSTGDAAINSGRNSGQRQFCINSQTITAAMITYGSARFSFGNQDGVGTVDTFIVQVVDATGVVRSGGVDEFTLVNDDVLCTFGGGASPDIQDTDVVTILATLSAPPA